MSVTHRIYLIPFYLSSLCPLSCDLLSRQTLICFLSLKVSFHFLQFNYKEDNTIYTYFRGGFFCSAWWFWFIHLVANINSFIPLSCSVVFHYMVTLQCVLMDIRLASSFLLLVDIWVAKTIWLLQLKLLRAFMYKSMHGHKLWFLLGVYALCMILDRIHINLLNNVSSWVIEGIWARSFLCGRFWTKIQLLNRYWAIEFIDFFFRKLCSLYLSRNLSFSSEWLL